LHDSSQLTGSLFARRCLSPRPGEASKASPGSPPAEGDRISACDPSGDDTPPPRNGRGDARREVALSTVAPHARLNRLSARPERVALADLSKIERSVARRFQSGQSLLGHPCRGRVGKDLAVRLNQAPPGLAPFRCSTACRVGGVRSGLCCRQRPDPKSTFGTLFDLTDSSDDLLPVESREVGAWSDVWRDLVGQLPYDFHGTGPSGHWSAVQAGRTIVGDDAGGIQSNDRH
jgi:hypothetical protein